MQLLKNKNIIWKYQNILFKKNNYHRVGSIAVDTG